MRILLLARNNGDWWTSLKQGEAALGTWLEATPPRELAALAVQEAEREHLFRHAVKAFAEAQKKPIPDRPPPALMDPLFERALYLHIAALAFVEEELELAPNKLMDVILDHEERFWGTRAPGNEAEAAERRLLARQMVAAATLRGGIVEKAEVREIAGRFLGSQPSKEEDALLRLLQQVYQRKGGAYLPPLAPDLLGEGMVLRVAEPKLEGDRVPADWIEWVFPPDEHGDAVTNGLTVLGRASAGQPRVLQPWIERMLSGALAQRAPLALEAAKAARSAFSMLGEVLADRLEAGGDVAMAHALEERVPIQTVSLRRVGAWMNRTLLEALPQSDKEEVLAERARQLNNLGIRLRELGRWQEALEATHKSVEHCRALVQRTDGFSSELARGLHNLAAMLSAVGRREEALAASVEAVERYRLLAKREPDASLPELATSLDLLGVQLSRVGRRDEALTATRDAVGIRRKLAELNPDAFRHALASSLHNLGNRFGDLGRRDEALGALKESVELDRLLVRIDSDAYLPDLADGLNDWGFQLSAARQLQKALEVIQEAVRLRRALAKRNPDAFLPQVAGSLNNLGMTLSELGRKEEALEANQEAVEIRRALVASNPDAVLPDLAKSLCNLGLRMREMGQQEDALVATDEALDTIWPFFARVPEAFAGITAKILNQLLELHEVLQKPIPSGVAERLATFQRLTQH